MSWRVFHDRLLLGRCFIFFSCPFWSTSAVWCWATGTHHKLMDRAFSGAQFLTGGVFGCDIAHRRSVAVLCMLHKISCNPIHPLYGALTRTVCASAVYTRCPGPRRFTSAPPRCRTSLFRGTFVFLSVSLWNALANPLFDGVGPAGFKSRASAF